MRKIKSIKDMVTYIKNNKELKQQLLESPEKTLLENFEIVPDNSSYRFVVFFLGLTITLVVVGYFVITIMGIRPLDPAVLAMASFAVGALAGLLAPPPS